MKQIYIILICWLLSFSAAHAQETPSEPYSGSLYLVGQILDNQWNPGNAPELTRTDDGKYVIRNVILWKDDATVEADGNNNVAFQFLTGRDWSSPRYLASSKDEDVNGGKSGNLTYWTSGNGQPENNFVARRGVYDVTVDFTANTVTLERISLYLVGQTLSGPWNPSAAPQLEETADGKYQVKNVVLWHNQYPNEKNATFQFLTRRDWSTRWVASESNEDVNDGKAGTLVSFIDGSGAAQDNFNVNRGVYDVTVDFSSRSVTLTPGEDYKVENSDFRMSFWEGPINEALRGENEEAKNVPFQYVGRRDNYLYYKIDVSANNDPINYVSQCWVGGQADYDYITRGEDGVWTRVSSKLGNGNSAQTFFFDVHTSDVFVPLKKEFWCDNSRMEVGMMVKAIYLRYDLSSVSGDNDVPVDLLFSSTGDVDYDAPEQRPLNSDLYSLTLSEGSVYETLRRTRKGDIEVQFVRHSSAEWGYVINLGRDITTAEAEKFVFNVNGRPVNAGFDMTRVNTLVAPGGENRFAEGLTFNRIILMVSGRDYDQYALYLSNGGAYPEGYEAHTANPQLKVWANNDASWTSLFNNESIKPTHTEGTVKYYEFTPVKSEEGMATNLYHLEFPGGVTVHRAGWEGNKHDQFNIIDQNGYDISNPYRGSQYIYPGNWWCANPNLMDENGPREYLGVNFKAIPDLPSRVDLSFNLPEGEEEVTIYGITLFKIIGRVFSVYTEGERYSNLYYLYVHTTPGDAAGVTDPSARALALAEKSSPILLRVKNAGVMDTPESFDAAEAGTDPSIYSSVKLKEFVPMAGSRFNDPGFSSSDRYYHLSLSDIRLANNDDLNYVLESPTLKFRPGNKQAMEFVSVTGSQRWSAPGTDDELRANKWSNYYSGYFSKDRSLVVQRPKAEYYKVVLATNPDQVRFQIMSDDVSMLSRPEMDYSPVTDNGHDIADDLIYPVSDLSTIMVWREGYTIDYSLDFLGKDESVCDTRNLSFTSLPEGSVLPDMEAFYAPGETAVEVDLGKYFIDPDKVASVRGTARYIPVSREGGDGAAYVKSAVTDVNLEYAYPVLADLSAHPELPVEYAWGTTYTSSLSWTTDGSDYPRHYEVWQYDLTGVSDKEGHLPVAPAKLTDGISDHIRHDGSNADNSGDMMTYSFPTATIKEATPLYKGEDIDGKKTVTIGYRARAVYKYAVPEAGVSSNDMRAAISYSSIPEGFAYRPVSSHGDSLTDHAYAASVFNEAKVSGVEDVATDGDDATVEYFNLQGIRVENPASGIYLRRCGGKTEKVCIP